jgi:hypothetical protein
MGEVFDITRARASRMTKRVFFSFSKSLQFGYEEQVTEVA